MPVHIPNKLISYQGIRWINWVEHNCAENHSFAYIHPADFEETWNSVDAAVTHGGNNTHIIEACFTSVTREVHILCSQADHQPRKWGPSLVPQVFGSLSLQGLQAPPTQSCRLLHLRHQRLKEPLRTPTGVPEWLRKMQGLGLFSVPSKTPVSPLLASPAGAQANTGLQTAASGEPSLLEDWGGQLLDIPESTTSGLKAQALWLVSLHLNPNVTFPSLKF